MEQKLAGSKGRVKGAGDDAEDVCRLTDREMKARLEGREAHRPVSLFWSLTLGCSSQSGNDLKLRINFLHRTVGRFNIGGRSFSDKKLLQHRKHTTERLDSFFSLFTLKEQSLHRPIPHQNINT
jgi:hypothetical protein